MRNASMLLLFFTLAASVYSSQQYLSIGTFDFTSVAGQQFEDVFPFTASTADNTFRSNLILSTASADPPTTIFLPRSLSTSDLPNEIYMCPGTLAFNSELKTKWVQTGNNPKSYYYSYQECLPPCLNFLRWQGDPRLPVCGPYPWGSTTSAEVQWATDNLINRMTAARFVSSSDSLWSQVYADAQINVDYYPYPAIDYTYQNQKATAGIVCKGNEVAYSVDITSKAKDNFVRVGGYTSPAPISGYPANGDKALGWSIPKLQNHANMQITLGAISYSGTTYELKYYTDTQECGGAIKSETATGCSALQKKQFYSGTSSFGSNDPKFTVHVVDPKTCKIEDKYFSFSPSAFSNLAPSTNYHIDVYITNPYQLFDMEVYGVEVIPPSGVSDPKQQWSVASTNPALPPNLDLLYNQRATLGIDLKSPQTLGSSSTSLTGLTVRIKIRSKVPFCDGKICNDEIIIKPQINPQSNCYINATLPVTSSAGTSCNTVGTGLSPVTVKPGDDICFTTTCMLDNYPWKCPQMVWTPSGFEDLNPLKKNNISFKLYSVPTDYSKPVRDYTPGNVPYIPSDVPNSLNTPVDPQRKVTTTDPVPSAVLYTYRVPFAKHNPALITQTTSTGKVSVAGTDAGGKSYSCPSAPISVGEILLPDLVPTPTGIKDVTKSDELKKQGKEKYDVTYGVKNTGHGPATNKFTVQLSEGSTVLQTFDVSPNFNVNAVQQQTFTYQCLFPSTHRVIISVDSQNTVDEESETNNKASATIICGNVLACADII